jgi:hypothetical protein
MSAHNALALRMIIDQLAPLLPKNSKEVNAQVKHLQAMLDAAIGEDPTPQRGDRRWGQDPDHYPSSHRDSASSITPLEERGQGWDRQDVWDVIRNKDTCRQIKNRPITFPSWRTQLRVVGVRAFSHNLKGVHWPLNFRPSGIEVYQLAIEAAGGDSYAMANYLHVCLSLSARTWLLGLLTGSVCS